MQLKRAEMTLTTSELLLKYASYGDAKGKIRRLVASGGLIPVTRGVYENDRTTDPIWLAPWICSPSYLSFDYVLHIHDLIPEAVVVYTCATCGKRHSRTCTNAFGTYTFRDVPLQAFAQGVEARTAEGRSCLVASCEKALCDKLYTLSPVRNISSLEALLFEDLRIDEEAFWSLNLEDLMTLAPLYHSTNLDRLARMIARRRK